MQDNPLLISVEDDYPFQGLWVGAFMDFLPHFLGGYDEHKERVDSIAKIAEENYGLLPTEGRNPGELFTVRVDSPGNIDWIKVWTALKDRNVRNFYYWGHGSESYLGDAQGGFGQQFLQLILGNNFDSALKQRFRFVWLDGCSTAHGDWPHAFALGKRENVPVNMFSSRPGLFCGFTDTVSVGNVIVNSEGQVIGGSIPDRVGFFRSQFAFHWSLLNKTAVVAFSDARINSGAFDDWIKLKLYGYSDLRYGQFNQRSGWPLP